MGNITDIPNKCDYFECGKPIDPESKCENGMEFCKEHDKEIISYVESGNVKAMLRFWVKAQGGAERATKRAMEGLYGRTD